MSTTNWWIVGTGLHACKAAEAVLAGGDRLAGFADEAPAAASPWPGVTCTAVSAMPAPQATDRALVAIGRPDVRERLMLVLEQAGWQLAPLVHPRAWVSARAALEAGVFVAAGAVVEVACRVGRGAIVDVGCVLDHECIVEPFAHLRAAGAMGPRARLPAGRPSGG